MLGEKVVYNKRMARKKKDDAIIFQAEVVKVMTMADGSPRVILGASENAIPQAAMLMECQRRGILLEITCKEAPKTTAKVDKRGL